MAARSKTPDPTGLTLEESQALLEGTRLGRILGPIVKAIGKMSAGENVDPEDLALENMARRINLLSEEARREEIEGPGLINLQQEMREAEAINAVVEEVQLREDEVDPEVELDKGSEARSVQEQIADAVREQLAEQYTPDTTTQRVLVEPPVFFSNTPVLKGRDRIDELKLNFSCLGTKGKFSGLKDYQKRGELDVISFLESLSRGQMVMRLTEDEFLRTMIMATTGAPQELLMGLIKQNAQGLMTIAAIYLTFTDSYFFELRPEQAMAKLQQLSPSRHHFECLSEAETQIKQWAKLASLEHKNAHKRTSMAEWHFKDFYLKIIPEKFSSAMIQSIARLEGLRNREVTSTELIAMTRSFRFEIDSIFYRKNHNQHGGSKNTAGGANVARAKKGKVKSSAAGKVQVMTRQQTKAANTGAPKGKQYNGTPKSNGQTGVGKSSSSGNGRGNNGSPGQKTMTTNPATWTEKHNPHKHPHPQTALTSNGCRLCGQGTHIFANCLLFKPHERVVGQNMCPCPMKCYHLPKHCPISQSKN